MKFWIARDGEGDLWVFGDEPIRGNETHCGGCWLARSPAECGLEIDSNDSLGNNLTWDDPPRKVALFDPANQVVVDKEKKTALEAVLLKITSDSKELEPEFAKIINDNLWELT